MCIHPTPYLRVFWRLSLPHVGFSFGPFSQKGALIDSQLADLFVLQATGTFSGILTPFYFSLGRKKIGRLFFLYCVPLLRLQSSFIHDEPCSIFLAFSFISVK